MTIAKTLDDAAREVGVNFIGGYSALVSKGMTKSDELLIRSIPQALAETEYICSSVNVGSTKTGINMDAVRLMGDVILQAAEYTKENDSLGCAKLVVFLQCTGRQSVYGRSFPRRDRGGCDHQCRRIRSGSC